jgi:hypothetical protein
MLYLFGDCGIKNKVHATFQLGCQTILKVTLTCFQADLPAGGSRSFLSISDEIVRRRFKQVAGFKKSNPYRLLERSYARPVFQTQPDAKKHER